MPDVQDLLKEAVGSFEPRGDQRSVERRVERRRRTRQLSAGFVALGLFAAAGWFAWTALQPGEGTPGSTGSQTYVLSEFQVAPHLDPATGEADPTRADVTFIPRWSTAAYPGVHPCELRVFAASGSQIGSLSFELTALSQGRSGPMVAPVDAPIEGATATGSCEPGRLDAPVAVAIANARIVDAGDHLSIRYDVEVPEVPEGLQLGAQACTAAVWSANGRLLGSASFAGAAVGEVGEVPLEDDSTIGDAAEATVTCTPFIRANAFPDPEPPGGATAQPVVTLVPNVAGLSPAEARAILADLGLAVTVTLEPSEEVPAGLVTSQQPAAGVEVTAGASVELHVSTGPAPNGSP